MAVMRRWFLPLLVSVVVTLAGWGVFAAIYVCCDAQLADISSFEERLGAARSNEGGCAPGGHMCEVVLEFDVEDKCVALAEVGVLSEGIVDVPCEEGELAWSGSVQDQHWRINVTELTMRLVISTFGT